MFGLNGREVILVQKRPEEGAESIKYAQHFVSIFSLIRPARTFSLNNELKVEIAVSPINRVQVT